MADARKVEASKESAQRALESLDGATTVDLGDEGRGEAVPLADFEFLCDFVRAAARRLPSEAAIRRDKARKKKYGGASARRDGTGAAKPKG